jgi:polyisoprenoid-binding protein YceI
MPTLRILLVALFLFGLGRTDALAQPAAVPSWTVDHSHSEVGFAVRHLGISTVRGRFETVDATFQLDPSDLTTFSTTATVDVASINTRNQRRDGHLRSDDFFDAETHPTLTFVSKRVTDVDGDSFKIVGDLTMRGTTREVVLDARVTGRAAMGDTERIAIEAETTVDRFDYGLHWDRMTEAGGLVVSRDVRITLEIQGIKS